MTVDECLIDASLIAKGLCEMEKTTPDIIRATQLMTARAIRDLVTAIEIIRQEAAHWVA